MDSESVGGGSLFAPRRARVLPNAVAFYGASGTQFSTSRMLLPGAHGHTPAGQGASSGLGSPVPGAPAVDPPRVPRAHTHRPSRSPLEAGAAGPRAGAAAGSALGRVHALFERRLRARAEGRASGSCCSRCVRARSLNFWAGTLRTDEFGLPFDPSADAWLMLESPPPTGESTGPERKESLGADLRGVRVESYSASAHGGDGAPSRAPWTRQYSAGSGESSAPPHHEVVPGRGGYLEGALSCVRLLEWQPEDLASIASRGSGSGGAADGGDEVGQSLVVGGGVGFVYEFADVARKVICARRVMLLCVICHVREYLAAKYALSRIPMILCCAVSSPT